MIRPCKMEDLPHLLKIEQECFLDPFSENMIKSELENPLGTYLLIEESGEIFGYGGYSAVLDEADIITIGVLPKVQGKGFGRMLLETLIQKAKEAEIKKLWLEVRISNASAIHLYESVGFHKMGIRKGYYEVGHEDALTMMKEI